jgi:hypothetical protein
MNLISAVYDTGDGRPLHAIPHVPIVPPGPMVGVIGEDHLPLPSVIKVRQVTACLPDVLGHMGLSRSCNSKTETLFLSLQPCSIVIAALPNSNRALLLDPLTSCCLQVQVPDSTGTTPRAHPVDTSVYVPGSTARSRLFSATASNQHNNVGAANPHFCSLCLSVSQAHATDSFLTTLQHHCCIAVAQPMVPEHSQSIGQPCTHFSVHQLQSADASQHLTCVLPSQPLLPAAICSGSGWRQ